MIADCDEKNDECMRTIQNRLLSSTKEETAFIQIGFNLEKCNGFHTHDFSDAHMEAAMARYATAPATSLGDGDVGGLHLRSKPSKRLKVY